MLAAFGALSIDMYLPGLPAIADELHTGMAAVQQTLAAFFLGMALGQLLYGPISDRLGRRPPLLVGCGLYVLASLGCALAPSIQSLVLLRFAQAVGACAGMVLGRAVVRDLFDPREAARMYSLLMLLMGAAPITAPLIGGQILLAFGWRAIFVALAGFGLACFAAVLVALPETAPRESRPRSGAAAVLRAYGGLLADRRFMAYAALSALALGAMFTYIAGSPFVFIELHGVRPERYGLVFGTNALGLIGAAQLNRWLLRQYGSAQLLGVGLRVMATCGVLLALATVLGVGGFPAMLVLLFGCVASNGVVQPNVLALALAPHGRQAGSASALIGASQAAVGAALGMLVGLLHNGTAAPMVGLIALCTSMAFLILQRLRSLPLDIAFTVDCEERVDHADKTKKMIPRG
jgi:DHA1 family bicyclomycin/chloramphenicol resistance-like MFS transporter